MDDMDERGEVGRSEGLCSPLFPGDSESSLRPKTWMVPLSLDAANHRALDEKARLCISALSVPLLTCVQ